MTADRIEVLREADATVDRLLEVWSGPSSFALLSDRLPISPDEVAAALRLIPAPLARDHYVLLTSGSTGTPKFVVGAKSRTSALAEVIHEQQTLFDVRETIIALPLVYSYAFVNQFVWATTRSRRLRQTTGLSEPAALVDALSLARDAMLCLTGAQLPLLVRAASKRVFPGVVRLNFAGGRFPQESLQTLSDLFPNARVYNNYGCAEALPRLTCRAADDAHDASDIGWTIPGVELRATTEQDLEFRSPYGAVGIIEADGYRTIGPTEWTPTGDMGAGSADGRWRLLGRRGDVFKRYGEKVSLPTLLGTVLQTWTNEAAFYVERDRSGEAAHVLVLAPTPTRDEARKILLALRGAYPRAAWPVRIMGAAQLPRLPNGKVDLTALSNLGDAVQIWTQHL